MRILLKGMGTGRLVCTQIEFCYCSLTETDQDGYITLALSVHKLDSVKPFKLVTISVRVV